MTDTALARLRHQLVDGIPRFERRRSRFRVLTGGAIVVASVIGLVSATVVVRGPNDDEVATDVETGEDIYDQPQHGVSLERLSEEGVPAVLVATSGNEFGISVVDLNGGYQAIYPDGVHTAGEQGALSGAVLTADDRLVLWRPDQPAIVYGAARDTDGRHQLIDGGLADPGVEIGTNFGERTILPTDRGDAVWILAASDGTDARLELVDLDTGDLRIATTVPPESRLVDAMGDDAIIGTAAAANGVLVVSPSGSTRRIMSPEPARLVAVTATATAWIAGGDPQSVVGDRLLVATDSGTTTIPLPEEGGWVNAGAPTIPSNSPHLPTVTSDGGRLLVALTNPADPNRVADRVVVVDLEQQSATVVYEGDGASSAFWAGDDRTAIVIEGTGQDQGVTAIDTTTGRASFIEDAVPPGFFVVAGR